MPYSSTIPHAKRYEAEDTTTVPVLPALPLPRSLDAVLHGSNSIPWNHGRSTRHRGESFSRGMHCRPFRHVTNSGVQILFALPSFDHRHTVGTPQPQTPSPPPLRLEAHKVRSFPPGYIFRGTRSGTRCFLTASVGEPRSHHGRSRSTSETVWQARLRSHVRPGRDSCDERSNQNKRRVALISYGAHDLLYVGDAQPLPHN